MATVELRQFIEQLLCRPLARPRGLGFRAGLTELLPELLHRRAVLGRNGFVALGRIVQFLRQCRMFACGFGQDARAVNNRGIFGNLGFAQARGQSQADNLLRRPASSQRLFVLRPR